MNRWLRQRLARLTPGARTAIAQALADKRRGRVPQNVRRPRAAGRGPGGRTAARAGVDLAGVAVVGLSLVDDRGQRRSARAEG